MKISVTRRLLKAALFSVFLLLLNSCNKGNVQSVDREDLFTLDIGRFEDQIDLFNLEGNRSVRKTRLVMRDGLFYIADGNGGKILKFTSYGDILFMIYNDETNPPPLTLKENPGNNTTVTRWAYAYPLREPGEIAVDSRKHIYVEDRLPQERHSFDPENRALLDSMVLHFDAEGRFIEYLGKEGIGGTPFPRISGIYTSVRDEVAVVCRIAAGWNIYWYDNDGVLLYLIQVRDNALPVPPDRELFASLDSIAVSPDSRSIYIKIDYYQDTFDKSTNTKLGTTMDNSMIWIMNAEDGSYRGSITVPFFEREFTENNRRITENMTYSMTGVAGGGSILLSVPAEGGYGILMFDEKNQNRQQGFIRVDNDELQFNAFHFSMEGILSGLLATDLEAKLVWWRTDQIMNGGQD